MDESILPINELYPAIQGEGSRSGIPTIVIRFVGCTHRCWFGEVGGWCDSWMNSIHPEKGKYTFNDIVKIYEKYFWIKEMMITGGSPTMHPQIVNRLVTFAHDLGITVTLETEGSHFIKTDSRIDLVSLSPKFSNSIPKLGITTPKGKVVDERFIKTHERHRLNVDAIRAMLKYHKTYQYKPVWDGNEEVLKEIEEFRIELNIPRSRTWLMPAGDNRDSLLQTYPICIQTAIERGYNFTGRPHIIAFNTERRV